MSTPDFTMRQLIEAGVHYGHQAHRWNPLMAEFIHSKKNGIHIIDLTQTVPMLDYALKTVSDVVAEGGSILFVGTKRQAQKPIKDAAVASAQFYINQRWLGGTLTNWKTVSNSIQRLNSIDEKLEAGVEGLTKKELLGMRREQAKLQASLGGIRDMRGLPSMLFVVDVNKEAIAVAEAAKLSIPVVAVVDTNCAPHNIDYLIPGNDDASRAVSLYCELMSRAALAGLQREISKTGEDIGASVEGLSEQVLEVAAVDTSDAKSAADPVIEATVSDPETAENVVRREVAEVDSTVDDSLTETVAEIAAAPEEQSAPEHQEADTAGNRSESTESS